VEIEEVVAKLGAWGRWCAALGVEVRVGCLCGAFVTGGGRGVWGAVGDWQRVGGEAVVAPPQPRAAGGVRGEEGNQARRRRSLTGKESHGEGVRWGRRVSREVEEDVAVAC
jgi:hypothetical protein